jgi:hypothetical protein
MESGKHWISLKLVEGEELPVDGNGEPDSGCLLHYFGLVRDGAAWDKFNHIGNADAWCMDSTGYTYGNEDDDEIDCQSIDGEIVSMEADLDKGTLRFWLNGKQFGPGFVSGVHGRLRWATSMAYKGSAVEIVPTPERQPWSASWVKRDMFV